MKKICIEFNEPMNLYCVSNYTQFTAITLILTTMSSFFVQTWANPLMLCLVLIMSGVLHLIVSILTRREVKFRKEYIYIKTFLITNKIQYSDIKNIANLNNYTIFNKQKRGYIKIYDPENLILKGLEAYHDALNLDVNALSVFKQDPKLSI